MTEFRTIIMMLLTCFLFSRDAEADKGITFGVEPETVSMFKKDTSSKRIGYLFVHLEYGYALLYDDFETHTIYLSIFRDGNEIILWQKEDGGSVTSLQVPPPILATMKINSNETLDLIFIYSINQGIGKCSRTWKRELLIFFDSENVAKRKGLSSEDVRVDDSEPKFKYYNSDGAAPAHTLSREVFLKPFNRGVGNNIYLWSKREEFGGAENIERRVIEKIMIYSADNKRRSVKRTIDDKKTIKTTRDKLKKEGWIKLE